MKKLAIVIATICAFGLMVGCSSTNSGAGKSSSYKDYKGEHDYKGETRMK